MQPGGFGEAAQGSSASVPSHENQPRARRVVAQANAGRGKGFGRSCIGQHFFFIVFDRDRRPRGSAAAVMAPGR